MLMVIPVYGTDRQSQRKLSPREGGDCTHSATCPQHTHKLSSFLYPVLWGILGGSQMGLLEQGSRALPRLLAHSDGSPAPVPVACHSQR